MAYSSSPAASSFFSSVISAEPVHTDCSPSLKSAVTPHKQRLVSRFQHSKSHSISGSREATPVKTANGENRRANSEKIDRQKTASLPLPRRRQLSLNVDPHDIKDKNASEAQEDRSSDIRNIKDRTARVSILNEDVFNSSTAADNCSFVTITGNVFSNRRDSNCTLNSNSYKEQYILGSNYNNNINRHSQEHYDSMLLSSSNRVKETFVEDAEITGCGTGEYIISPAKAAQNVAVSDRHHYETNSKSLEDVL